MRKLLALLLLLPLLAHAGSVTGNIQTASSGGVVNGTLTFTLNQVAVVSGTAQVVATGVNCYTSTAGAITGEPDPQAAPVLSVNLASGTLAAGTYFVKYTFFDATGESLPSPEASITLASQGTLIVAAPANPPANATGWRPYISSATGTETRQSSQTGFAASYQQTAALSAGAALPGSNSSVCSIRFTDEMIPTTTYYTINLVNSGGSKIAGYPISQARFYGGTNGSVNVSSGWPVSIGGVIWPSPIVSTPNAGAKQSIAGPLDYGAVGQTSTNSGNQAVAGLANLNGGGQFGGLWNKALSSTPSILQIEDLGTRNAQLIGLGVEQFLNPSSSVAYLNFGSVTELLIPSANTQTFTGQQTGVYGDFINFGSGNFTAGTGAGGGFEGFNVGSATALLIQGVSATANNGGPVSGTPLPNQTPTNNGSATNLRAFDGIAKNISSGTVTNGVAFYAESPLNSGGGTFTNAYGLFVADMTAATNNFAIKTGLGKVDIGDVVRLRSTLQADGTQGIGLGPVAGTGLLIFQPTNLAGTTQIGLQSALQTTSGATGEGAGVVGRADTAAAAYTQALNVGVEAQTPTVGAGSAITEWNGVRIDAAPAAGTKCSEKVFGSTSGSTCINTSAVAGGTASWIISTSFTTTAAATDNVTVTGMTSSGHCSLEPTNTAAAAGIASVFVSAKAANQITVTHTATANWTFDVMCSPI